MNENVSGKLQILGMLLLIILVVGAFAYVFTHTAVQYPDTQAKLNDTLDVVVQPEDVKLAPKQVQDFYAYALNGTAPYTFYWEHQLWYSDSDHTVRTYFSDTNSTPFAFKNVTKYAILYCTVTDAEGSKGFDTVVVYDPQAFTISAGVYPGAPSSTVWEEDGTYYSKNAYGQASSSSTNGSYVVNNAVSSLTSSRTSMETVLLTGDFQLTNSILLPNYTHIVVDGTISKADNTHIFSNEDHTNGNMFIEINGGTLEGKQDDYTSDSYYLIDFVKVAHAKINNMRLVNTSHYAINLDQCGDMEITNNYFYNNEYFDILIDGFYSVGTSYAWGGLIAHNRHDTAGYGFLRVTAVNNYCVDWIITDNFLADYSAGVLDIRRGETYGIADFYILNNYFDQGTYHLYATGASCFLIQGNKFEEAQQHCLIFEDLEKTNTIDNNFIADAGKSADVTYDGIVVLSIKTNSDADHNYESLKITNNIIRSKHTTSYGTSYRTRYALNILPTINNTWITNNYFEAGTAAWNQTAGTNYYHYGNINGTIAAGVVTYSYP